MPAHLLTAHLLTAHLLTAHLLTMRRRYLPAGSNI